MDFGQSEASSGIEVPLALKILIAGGFGAGKTTMVGSLSEIATLSTEEVLSDVGIGVDDVSTTDRKETTTVAMDFGRITIDRRHILYLFGTPGQERFWFMWDELSAGAMGAVVLADTRRLQDCFAAVDFFESRGIGFLVAINQFDNSFRYDAADVRSALDLKPDVPIVSCDARDSRSATGVLVQLIQHLLGVHPTPTAIRSLA